MTWSAAIWPLVVAALVLVVPGLLVGLAAGLRGVGLVSTAPLLSCGALTSAIVLGSALHLRWGLLPLLLATVLLVLAGACVGVLPRMVRERRLVRPGLPQRRTSVDMLVVVGTAFVSGAVLFGLFEHAMGTPDAVQQSWDAAFHLNAIDHARRLGSATPSTIAQTADLSKAGGFYPPLFHAVAVLLIYLTGVSVPAAANLTALVAACVVWPLSIIGLTWSLVPRRVAVLAAGALVTFVSAFPVLLMSFGVLWPNLVGLAALPPAVAIVAGLLLPVRSPGPAPALLFSGVVGAAGLYYAHPGTIFAGVALCLPLLVVVVLRLAVRLGRLVARRVAGAPGIAAGIAVGAVVLAIAWYLGASGWHVIDTLPQIQATRAQDWKAVESFAQSIGESLTFSLGSHMHPLYVVGALAVVGAVVAAQDRRVWLVAAHVITIYLYLLAAGTDDPISTTLTGFWYNDRYRILAVLPLTGIVLAVIGVVAVVDRLTALARRRLPRRPGSSWDPVVLVEAALVVVLVALAVASPLGKVWDTQQRLVTIGYEGEPGRVLADPAEVALYEGLAREPDPSKAVTGSPFTGAVLAGVLSGRPWIFGHMKNDLDHDQELVATRFKDFTHDRAVCDAVQRLDIGYVTEDTQLFQGTPEQLAQYNGLTGLQGVAGLTPVEHEGTVTAYRVGPCQG